VQATVEAWQCRPIKKHIIDGSQVIHSRNPGHETDRAVCRYRKLLQGGVVGTFIRETYRATCTYVPGSPERGDFGTILGPRDGFTF
jgi:hypothetical protein